MGKGIGQLLVMKWRRVRCGIISLGWNEGGSGAVLSKWLVIQLVTLIS